MRFIPAPENPDDFFTDSISDSSRSSFTPSQRGKILPILSPPLLTPFFSTFIGLIQAHKGDDIEAFSQLQRTPSSRSYNPLQQGEVIGSQNGRNGHMKSMSIGK